jgi:hypothetical protein
MEIIYFITYKKMIDFFSIFLINDTIYIPIIIYNKKISNKSLITATEFQMLKKSTVDKEKIV